MNFLKNLLGMSAASVLSRVGRSCVVLEHHYVAGGWTH